MLSKLVFNVFGQDITEGVTLVTSKKESAAKG